MVVREAKREECGVLSALYIRSWGFGLPMITMSWPRECLTALAWFRHRIANEFVKIVGAIDGVIAGIHEAGTVDPDHRH